jgi:hypothetical protein
MKHYFSFSRHCLFYFFSQAHAELVINGATVLIDNCIHTSTYSPTSIFRLLANLRSQAIASGVSGQAMIVIRRI